MFSVFTKYSAYLPGILAALSLLVFLPSLQNGFNNWDDIVYITGQPTLGLSWENLRISFFEGEYHGMYVPLTSVSMSVNYHLTAFSPWSYHLANIIIHALNVFLVYVLIRRISRSSWISFFVTLLFAIHPVQAESVAYAAGRRDLLFSLFVLLSLIYYTSYLRKLKLPHYYSCLFLFLLALLSKGQAVAVAPLLFVFDYLYKRKISKRLFLEKAPFFLLAIFFGLVTVYVSMRSETHGMMPDSAYPLTDRIAFAGYSYLAYMGYLLAPWLLSTYYPFPIQAELTHWMYGLASLIVFAGFLMLYRKSRNLLFGLLFYSLTIFLVLQLLQNSASMLNDHYMYLPCIGLFYMFIYFIYVLIRKRKGLQWPVTIALLVISTALAGMSLARNAVFRNSISLWTDAIEAYPDHGFAYGPRGLAKSQEGDYEGAIADMKTSIRLFPGYQRTYTNLAYVYMTIGQEEQALPILNTLLAKSPDYYEAVNMRGQVRVRLGMHDPAYADFTYAQQLKPEEAEPYLNRGFVLIKQRKFQPALADLEEARNRGESSYVLHFYSALAYMGLKKPQEALRHFTLCLEKNPDDIQSLLYRAMLLINAGRNAEGCADLQRAKTLGSPQAEKLINQYCRP